MGAVAVNVTPQQKANHVKNAAPQKTHHAKNTHKKGKTQHENKTQGKGISAMTWVIIIGSISLFLVLVIILVCCMKKKQAGDEYVEPLIVNVIDNTPNVSLVPSAPVPQGPVGMVPQGSVGMVPQGPVGMMPRGPVPGMVRTGLTPGVNA